MKTYYRQSVTIIPWAQNEVILLKNAIEKSGFNWIEIAKQIPHRSPNQCAQKWKRLNGERSHHKQFWSKQEDELLVQLVNDFGKKWTEIARRIKNRNLQQCRDRYINLLEPNIKSTPYTQEEDQLIYQFYLKHGPKWQKISKKLGRSGSQVKSRFYQHIRKHYLKIENPYYMQDVEDDKLMLQETRKHHLDQINYLNSSNEEQLKQSDSRQYYEFSNENICIEEGGHTSTFLSDEDA